MSFRIKVSEVNVEAVVNGKNRYEKAEVVHQVNGQSRTQKIMSFSNPAVFQKVKYMKPGEEWDVTVTKNDAGFNQWSAIERVIGGEDGAVADSAATPAKPTTGARTTVSTYETAEERKIKQLYIVKQSSIANAIELLKHNNPKAVVDSGAIIDVAQHFVDFVYGTNQTLAVEPEALADIPY